MEAQFGIGKKALIKLMETAKRKFPNFYKKHRPEENIVSNSNLKRKQRCEEKKLTRLFSRMETIKNTS